MLSAFYLFLLFAISFGSSFPFASDFYLTSHVHSDASAIKNHKENHFQWDFSHFHGFSERRRVREARESESKKERARETVKQDQLYHVRYAIGKCSALCAGKQMSRKIQHFQARKR